MTEGGAVTVYVSVGNSDDKLTQANWHNLTTELHMLAATYASKVHGVWFSSPDSPWQNACIAFDVTHAANVEVLKRELSKLAWKYQQDSIAWAEATTTFLKSDEVT